MSPRLVLCPSCSGNSNFSMDGSGFTCDDCGEEFSINDVQDDLMSSGNDFVWHPKKKF